MKLPGGQRRRRPAVSWFRYRRRRIGIAATISLLLHLFVGLLLLVTIRRTEQPELLPPPSAVTMLFDSGRRAGPTVPEPSLQARPPAPPVAPTTPQEVPLPTPPPPPVQPQFPSQPPPAAQ